MQDHVRRINHHIATKAVACHHILKGWYFAIIAVGAIGGFTVAYLVTKSECCFMYAGFVWYTADLLNDRITKAGKNGD
jgi:hypothetical protein